MIWHQRITIMIIIIIIVELCTCVRACSFSSFHISHQRKRKKLLQEEIKMDDGRRKKKKPNYVYFALCETSKWKGKQKVKWIMCLSHACVYVCVYARALIHIHILLLFSIFPLESVSVRIFSLVFFSLFWFQFRFQWRDGGVEASATSTDIAAVFLSLSLSLSASSSHYMLFSCPVWQFYAVL